jgi:hypothetical protein
LDHLLALKDLSVEWVLHRARTQLQCKQLRFRQRLFRLLPREQHNQLHLPHQSLLLHQLQNLLLKPHLLLTVSPLKP